MNGVQIVKNGSKAKHSNNNLDKKQSLTNYENPDNNLGKKYALKNKTCSSFMEKTIQEFSHLANISRLAIFRQLADFSQIGKLANFDQMAD